MSKRALTALLAFVALAVLVGTIVVTRETAPTLTREELLAYQDAIHPLMAEGGRIVEQGMKPAVADGSVDAAEADGWADSLRAVREQVAAVEPPEPLRDAAGLFVLALDSYVEAARLLGQGLVEDGVAGAKSADRTYDEASRILQNWRRSLGLGPTAEFPDPS